MGGHGDIHQKDSYHETAVSLSHWSSSELGYVNVHVGVDMHACIQTSYFSREIISQDSMLERAKGRLDPNFSKDRLPTRGHCNLTLIVRALAQSSHWVNDVNSMLPVVQADTMHHSEKGEWVPDLRGQTLLVSKARAHRHSRVSLGSSVDEN